MNALVKDDSISTKSLRIQSYPLFINATVAHLLAAKSMSQPLSTMNGHFPPSSSIQGTRFLAADEATSLPFSVLPVKTIRSEAVEVDLFAISTPPLTH